MRITYSIIFSVVIIAQLVCVFRARRSDKPIGKYVAALNSAVVPPLLGNLIIIGSHDKLISLIGSYMYFLGVDLVVEIGFLGRVGAVAFLHHVVLLPFGLGRGKRLVQRVDGDGEEGNRVV